MLSIVLYGYEIASLALREGRRLKVGRIFVPEREEVTWGLEKAG
jgi:hypothetical protein